MILVSGGDSFLYGTDLSDCDPSNIHMGYSRGTFAALLAAKHGFEHRCSAYPGRGNDSISRRVIDACHAAKIENPGQTVAALVGWTFPERYEFLFNYPTESYESPWYTVSHWLTLKKPWEEIQGIGDAYTDPTSQNMHNRAWQLNKQNGILDFTHGFLKNVGTNRAWAMYSTLKSIYYTQLFLKANDIPYMFVPLTHETYENKNDTQNRSTKTLYDLIDWEKWAYFPNPLSHNFDTRLSPGIRLGFSHWAGKGMMNFPLGATAHPTEQAHQVAAHELETKFTELILDRIKK